MQKPSIGRIVVALVPPELNNGSDEAPAVITRVWSEHPAGGWVVNLRILCDSDNTVWKTSVRLADERPDVVKRNVGAPLVAWWPPRV